MKMLKRLGVLLLMPWVAACAAKPITGQFISLDAQLASDVAAEVVEAPAIIETAISPQLLYVILGGEIAGQRGDFNAASAFYVAAARQSKNPELSYRAVQIALFNKDVRAASSLIKVLMDGLDGGQPSKELSSLALNVYLQEGDSDRSIRQASLLLKNAGVDIRNNMLALGGVIVRGANKETALLVIEGLLEDSPNFAAGYLVKSQILLRHKELVLAEESMSKAVGLAPNWASVYVQKARILVLQRKFDEALSVLEESNKKFDNKLLLDAYGQLLAQVERYAEAESIFVKSIKSDPKNHEARLSLAFVYLKLDKSLEAIDEFLSLSKVPVYRARSAFYLGRIYAALGEYGDAVKWFERVESGRYYIEAHSAMAIAKAKQGDLLGAQEGLQGLRVVAPQKATQLYVLEAEILLEAGKVRETLELMNQAIAEKPADLVLRYTRSIAAAELNEIALVEQDLGFILEAEPNNTNALNALGYTLASKTFRFDEAKGLLQKAMSLSAGDPAIMDSMGWLHYRSGEYESALVLLERAYQKAPEPEIAFHLGETLLMLGRQEEARLLWLKTIEQNPANKFSKKMLIKLK